MIKMVISLKQYRFISLALSIHFEAEWDGRIIANTPVSAIEEYLNLIDQVLVMSVEPGFGGQSFMPEALTKINQLNGLKSIYNKDLLIVKGLKRYYALKRLQREKVRVRIGVSKSTGADDLFTISKK